MTKKADTDNKDQMLTIWVMKDQTAEPTQYRVQTRKLKLAAVFAVVLPLALLLSLIGSGIRCTTLSRNNRTLSEIADKYQCSSEQLLALESRVSGFESEVSQSCGQVRKVISAMDKDLASWLPEDGMGGGEDAALAGASLDGGHQASSLLSPSQLEQVNNIKLRLSCLDEQLDSHDRTIEDIERAWGERNSLFSILPTSWPVEGGRITSEFGMRVHPITRKNKMHEGLDIAAPTGTPIHASAPGMVIFTDLKGGYGKTVTIDHGYGFVTSYSHCKKLLVGPGQSVKQGQVIAEVGNTGFSTGPHLHFEVQRLGIVVDPMQYLSLFSSGPRE